MTLPERIDEIRRLASWRCGELMEQAAEAGEAGDPLGEGRLRGAAASALAAGVRTAAAIYESQADPGGSIAYAIVADMHTAEDLVASAWRVALPVMPAAGTA